MPPPAKASLASIREKLNLLLLRLTPTERQRLLLLTILSGGLCGLAAVCFHVGIGKAEDLLINRALAAPFPTWIYLAILTPAVGGLLVGLYAVLYVLLSLEAFSLLIGSLLLFAALAGVMYATRRIDWGTPLEPARAAEA